MPACGVTVAGTATLSGAFQAPITETLYGNQVKDTVTQEYGTGYDLNKDFVRLPTATGQAGGCGCIRKTVQPPAKIQLGGAETCSGSTPMLKALGIMAGGKRTKRVKRNSTKKAECKCRPFFGGRKGGSKSSSYKPTARNLAALRKYKAGKSIGFTMRSSLKAKGLIPRANGTYKVSRKYR